LSYRSSFLAGADDAAAGGCDRVARALNAGSDQTEAETEAQAAEVVTPAKSAASGEVMAANSAPAQTAAAQRFCGSLGRNQRHRTQRRRGDKSNDNFAQHLIRSPQLMRRSFQHWRGFKSCRPPPVLPVEAVWPMLAMFSWTDAPGFFFCQAGVSIRRRTALSMPTRGKDAVHRFVPGKKQTWRGVRLKPAFSDEAEVRLGGRKVRL
jgi:hypothetical protein